MTAGSFAATIVALCIGPAWMEAQTAPSASSFDAAVLAAMDWWQLPGVVVVVVSADRVLMQQGYGTRVAGERRPVDDKTLVHLASHSKAITATAVAMLVDAGMLSWDDPVQKHIPEFAVADAWVTANLTVRDLVSHRGGLPAAAIGGFRNPAYRVADLLADLRTRRLAPFRAQQTYSQSGIALAGEIVARVSGVPWERFVRERIFAALGMSDSYTSTPDLLERFGAPASDRNIFIPARKNDGEIQTGTWSEVGTDRLYAPAGGIISNGSDMAKWIGVLLGNGEYPGGRLLSSSALEETRVPLIPLDPALSTFTDPVGRPGAGALGWNVIEHAGRLVYFAPGGWMSSVVGIVPEARVGVGVFTNAFFAESHGFESLFAAYALALQAIDLALGLPLTDWNAVLRDTLHRAADGGR